MSRPGRARTVLGGAVLVLAALVVSRVLAATAPADAPHAIATAATPQHRTHATAPPPLHPTVDAYPAALVDLVSPDGSRTHRLAVRVADTPERRRHGLMEVPVLPYGTGMLFVFEESRRGAFWMKGTLVPLSIAFAAADGTIRAVLAMEPCRSEPCPLYDPEVDYRTALEVPQGWFGDVGVEVGWRLRVVGADVAAAATPGAGAAGAHVVGAGR